MSQKTTAPHLPIREKDLLEHLKNANILATAVSWKRVKPAEKQGALAGSYLVSVSEPKEEELRLGDILRAISADDPILSDARHHILLTVRRALQVGFHMSTVFRKESGLDSIGDPQHLADAQRAEYNEKMRTASAVAVFAASRYASWSLVQHKAVEVTSAGTEHVHVLTCFDQPIPALQCLVFYLADNLSHPSVATDAAALQVATMYFEMMVDEVKTREESFKFRELFSNNAYQLEGTDFNLEGFDLVDLSHVVSVEFNRVSFDEIVGNRDGKHFAIMDAKRRLCFNFEAKKNPFQELGGITPVYMGYGVPGTGKSMIIAAIATALKDRCDALGIPFHFHPLPDNIIDSYQGNSAKNMVQWMRPMQDPSRILFAPIDDAENILEERTRQGVSEGVRAAIGVFLRYTEGAYAVNHGNAAIGIFTNLPEQLDKAVLSRIQARFAIAGARSVNDFLDQDHLWWSKIEKSESGFVGMRDPDGYQYGDDQKAIRTMGEVSTDLMVPQEGRIKTLYDEAVGKHDPNHHMFFAELYARVQKAFPLFSSRDVRNIQSAVNLRIMDFDLPDEWFENPETFVRQPYDRMMAMILELRRANMKGLSFFEIRLQEANRYLDNMARIADADFSRRVEAGVEDHRIREAILDATRKQA
ncbi:MAG: hypothetical protein A2408_00040 [Candidatus Yonathbacteria bacterium RIFOXYC1_FULL_52_10]|uniref:ATPase AAA-type core domain-containing protein n=1 Tax=Candidatus Yonathbacteria bacterium RIFOXYD1_FULL_52_36 TaxID=1802730 RepID=A0A1G2SL64_9BACT|nr:MAG: hypothetical protein A2408_00040 [Candidatus Yonathbacteria bacterium RIFOXYC1_FULL_52_10]OHA85777.1 MAG: hypothetical protein A2591_03625 [Candidatus Yonathbacteria bacterium RIFOXYD1_FULL_52_36]